MATATTKRTAAITMGTMIITFDAESSDEASFIVLSSTVTVMI